MRNRGSYLKWTGLLAFTTLLVLAANFQVIRLDLPGSGLTGPDAGRAAAEAARAFLTEPGLLPAASRSSP